MQNSSRNYSTTQWVRVTKAHPCPICQKDSWCVMESRGKVVMCMRVESQRPKLLKSGETGWFHNLDQPMERLTLPVRNRDSTPAINCGKLVQTWAQRTSASQLEHLASHLLVTTESLRALQVCWASEHRAWAFPMKDGYDNMVGIRLRSESGVKWAVRGSHQGCFVPSTNSNKTALVVEGATDTAAGLSLGFYTVGRPSCSGGVSDLRTSFKRHGVREAIIIGDNDDPGVRGADTLSKSLGVSNCVVLLPCKDLRQFLSLGGDRNMLDEMISQSVWTAVRS